MESKSPKFPWRPVLIAVIWIPFNSYWIAYQEVAWYARLTYVSPFPNVIFTIFLLAAFKAIFGRFSKTTLTHGELLIIYIMLSIASAISNNIMLAEVIPSFGYAYWFATPENEWKDVLWKYLPDWLTVNDRDVLKGYYKGDSSLYDVRTLRVWLSPIIAWAGFTFVLVFVMLCITTVLRRQWTENERLTYPITRLPLEMVDAKSGFFRNRLMWMGFAIAGGISLINGLNILYPVFPQIPITRQNIGSFTDRPWDAMGNTYIAFYPFIIGIGFLMPLDLSFSCWFFFLFRNCVKILISVFGLSNIPGIPFFKQQEFGSVLGLCIAAIWVGKRFFTRVLIGVFCKRAADDSDEPMPYRTAIGGIVVGCILLVVFSVRIGMSVWGALSFFAIYYAVSVTITRVRAELGFPVHAFEYLRVSEDLPNTLGSRRYSAGDLTGFALYTWFNRAYASHPMPHQLEGFKLTDSTPIIRRKQLSVLIMVAAFFGILACFWAYLDIYHRYGAMSGFGDWPNAWYGAWTYQALDRWLTNPSEMKYGEIAFVGVGAVSVFFLTMMRLWFLWWPFHPLGYIMSLGHWIQFLWLCLMISSVTKWIILKYGGPQLYRRASYFFLGLVLGDFVIGSLWLIYGTVLNTTVYVFFPGRPV